MNRINTIAREIESIAQPIANITLERVGNTIGSPTIVRWSDDVEVIDYRVVVNDMHTTITPEVPRPNGQAGSCPPASLHSKPERTAKAIVMAVVDMSLSK